MTIDPTKTKQLAETKHDAPLLCSIFDPTGRFVLAGGRDRGLVCIEIASNKKTMLDAHETWIGSVVRSGSDLVITADYAGHVVAWDCSGELPKVRWNIAAHPNTIYALAASADGRLLATGDRDGTIRVAQTTDGKSIHEIQGLEHPVYGLAFHPDGERLVSADRQPKKPRLKIWDFAGGKELRSIDVPQLSAYRRVEDIEWGGIRGMTISPDGNSIVACGSHDYSGPACTLFFDIATGELKRKLTSTLKGFCYGVKFHSQGFMLAASGDIAKGEFRAWPNDKDESLATVATPGPCTSLDIHPDARRFVISQTLGKGSYPDSGTLTLFEWAE